MKTHLGKEQKTRISRKKNKDLVQDQPFHRYCRDSSISQNVLGEIRAKIILSCKMKIGCKGRQILARLILRLVLSLDKGGAMVSQMLGGGEWRRVEESG